jgi:hypothetical protein
MLLTGHWNWPLELLPAPLTGHWNWRLELP